MVAGHVKFDTEIVKLYAHCVWNIVCRLGFTNMSAMRSFEVMFDEFKVYGICASYKLFAESIKNI